MRKWSKALICSIALAAAPLFATPAAAQYLQCAPYAREISGIQLFGNAGGWWAQASGKYDRGHAPKAGAVLVFKASGAMRVGHVATVSQVVSDREIKVTHANWSVIGGRRGQVERDVTVVDTSAANDWSQVKVWYAPIGKVGTRAYPVYGFVYADKAASPVRMASADLSGDSVTTASATAPMLPGLLAAAGTRTLLP
jgi:surface antigen